ncbi:MAG: HEAT repeat domain-containing protein [Pseudobdellovibrionaceae bacterium]
MKINVIRNLILPWILFFAGAVIAIVVVGSRFHFQAKDHPLFYAVMGIGVLICLIANMRTLGKAGIWIAHSLPSSLRYNSKPWLFRAVQVALLAGAFYLVGQMPWMPLFWHAFIIPLIFSLTLFVGIWSLMGPILTWASKISFSRMTAFLVSLPVFALVPLTATFLGTTIVRAYIDSRPELLLVRAPSLVDKKEKSESETADKAAEAPLELSPEAQKFKELAESGKPCYESTKEIQAALQPKGPEDVVYWAAKAVKCSEMKAVVALPRLVDIMIGHSKSRVRAAAIRAMPRFGYENVHRISYLLVKRINEKESPEVIEATAYVLARLGEDEKKWATSRLKSLLDDPEQSSQAAQVLMSELKREDLVVEYVSTNLPSTNEARDRAVGMICLLPKAQRAIAEPHIQNVVASIKTGGDQDPAMAALGCLGRPGLQAIRQEVIQPQVLEKPVAARALAEIDVKSSPEEALETADRCVRDSNEVVRKWCSQSLGKIGAPALPKILDLLKSKETELKDAGKNALNFFDDPNAKSELEKVRADNSGWMANKKKLQIAEAVSTALMKIQQEGSNPSKAGGSGKPPGTTD